MSERARVQRWLPFVAVLGLGAFCSTACRKPTVTDHDPPAPAATVSHARVVVAPDAGSIALVDPVPAGSLVVGSVSFSFAVYHAPKPTRPPKAALGEALAKGTFTLVAELPKEPPTKPIVMLRTPPLAEFAPPDEESFKYFARTLSEAERQAMATTAAVSVLVFAMPATQAIERQRAALALAADIATRTGGVLWDDETRQLLGRDSWSRRTDSWDDAIPDVQRHVTIHQYRDGELFRLVTLGMAKFGLPDLSVGAVASHDADSMGNLVNVACQTLVEERAIARTGELSLSLDRLRNKAAREAQRGSLKKGAKGEVVIAIAKVEPQKGDAQNAQIELVFPGPAGGLQERQNFALATLFGAEDSLTRVAHDEALLAASARAKQAVLKHKARFAKAPPLGEELLVKAPFRTATGGNEWMWVEVVRWDGTKISGILENDPFEVPGLKVGARVEVEESSLFDYLLRRPDGTTEGGETSKLLEAREKR